MRAPAPIVLLCLLWYGCARSWVIAPGEEPAVPESLAPAEEGYIAGDAVSAPSGVLLLQPRWSGMRRQTLVRLYRLEGQQPTQLRDTVWEGQWLADSGGARLLHYDGVGWRRVWLDSVGNPFRSEPLRFEANPAEMEGAQYLGQLYGWSIYRRASAGELLFVRDGHLERRRGVVALRYEPAVALWWAEADGDWLGIRMLTAEGLVPVREFSASAEFPYSGKERVRLYGIPGRGAAVAIETNTGTWWQLSEPGQAPEEHTMLAPVRWSALLWEPGGRVWYWLERGRQGYELRRRDAQERTRTVAVFSPLYGEPQWLESLDTEWVVRFPGAIIVGQGERLRSWASSVVVPAPEALQEAIPMRLLGGMLWKLPGGVLLLHRRAQPLWWVHAAVQWLWGHLGWAVVVGAVVLLGWMWLHPRMQLRRLLPKQLPWLWVGADGRVRGCSEGLPFALELRAMLREQSGLPSSFLHRLERARQSAHPHCWLWESTRDGQRREYLGYALPVRRWGVRGTICIILEVTQAVQERMGFYWKGLAHDVSNKLALLPEGSERQVLRQLQRNLRTLERLHPDSAQANSPREQVRLDELIAELCAEECQGLEDVEVVQRCMPVQLWANRELLKRALENALWNALKAVRQSERRQVVLRAYRRHREVVVEVEDSGPGLPQRLREGMGMRIMRWVVEGEHGGRLEFERGQNGQGTLVRFRFPKVLLNRVRNGDTA